MDLKETNKVMPNPVRLAMIERQDQEQKKKTKNDRYTVSSEDMNI